jgi:hypothetical protein
MRDEAMTTSGWVGVDLDGTLAHYDGWKGPDHIGAPIRAMLEHVKDMVARGETVKIFTARASEPSQIGPVKAWLKKQGLPDLEVTNAKDYGMRELYDDRAIQVVPNTGKRADGRPL